MSRAACLLGLIGLALVFVCVPQALAQTGDVQVTAPPGMRIYVDGRFKGVTTAQEDGKYLRHLPTGRHTIRAEKSGFLAKFFEVLVRPGEPVGIRVDQLKSDPRHKAGTLTFRSIPFSCQILFLGQVKNKTGAELVVPNVPAHQHRITFKRGAAQLTTDVKVGAGENLIVIADFLRKRVSTQHKNLGKLLTNTIGMKFVLIQPGSFMMGSPSGERHRNRDEGPRHRVVISRPFYLQTTEVTQAQYRAIMRSNPSRFKGCDQCPVEQVSWNDAQEFIRRLNALDKTNKYRLPTEAEWEYACRAGSGTAYYFGNNFSRLGHYAWYGANSKNRTKPVAQKRPNAWGLYDMHGNVWEWCQDWYDKRYYRRSPNRDPQGPANGCGRVLRGGSWFFRFRSTLRSARRYQFDPSLRSDNGGFRVVRIP